MTYIVRKRFIMRLNRRVLDVELYGPSLVPPEGWTRVEAEDELGAKIAFTQDSHRFDRQMWTLDDQS